MDISRPEILFVALMALLIVLFMPVACLSGWTILATFSPLSGSFNGRCLWFQSAELCWKRGWPDVSVTQGKRGFPSIDAGFRFGQVPTIPFRVNERLVQQMMESTGSPWPGKDRANKGDLERRQV
jgi:hypothetical protein